jgi:hypothetical protein
MSKDFIEITVILKDESRTIRQKFPIYDPVICSDSDPTIQTCISETRKNFDGEPSDCTIKISMEIV